MITFMIGLAIFMIVNLLFSLALQAGLNWWLQDIEDKFK